MLLAELLTGIEKVVNATGTYQNREVEITGITCDSRAVEPGFLFAALPGLTVDGREFIGEAVAGGAVAILAPEGTVLKDNAQRLSLITDRNPRQCYAKMASAFHGELPECIAAITGTNGKTSVADFTKQIWAGLGLDAGSAGTLGISATIKDSEIEYPGNLTTPDPTDLHKVMAELARKGVDHMAIEASSHGLDQYRLDGFKFQIAAFTNLSRDHLDYHENLSSYFEAKLRLFEDLLMPDGTAILNADVPEFSRIKNLVEKRGCRVISFGRNGADITLNSCALHDQGQRVSITLDGKNTEFDLPLIGDFQVENVLCALGIVMASGIDAREAVKILPTLNGVRGRLEHAGTLPNGAAVYVDFAHTADAIESVLKTMRSHVSGRLIVLFGCGGDRDPGKRIEMGRAASENADVVILSDDNPRSEDPASIRAQALQGCPGALEIGDRATAIARGVSMLEPGDLFVVAGKGHEQGQIIGDKILPFDDVDVVRAAIAEMGS